MGNVPSCTQINKTTRFLTYLIILVHLQQLKFSNNSSNRNNNNNENGCSDSRPFSPPDQFKFSKVQRLKLTVIQAALAPKEPVLIVEDGETITVEDCEKSLKRIPSRMSSSSSFDITDPRESFMATISTLIAVLNRAASNEQFDDSFWRHCKELLTLFTAVFVKNINIKGLVEVFEFEVEEGKVITEHLLTAYINFISSTNSDSSTLEEALRSLLILISSNLHCNQEQGRYFHSFLTGKLSSDHLMNLFSCLMEITCTFTYKSNGFLGSVPIISDKSRLSSQLLVSLLLGDVRVLKSLNDLKLFALFIKFQSQIYQFSFPNHLNLNDLTILTILSNAMTNFCPNYRRFVLSKLDNDELLISICRVKYFLMRGKLNKKAILSLNLYMLAEILVSFSEDVTFIKQIFDSELDRNLVKWYEGDLGTTSSLGGFIFCLLFDLIGANLAANDGFKDENLHRLLTATCMNLAQYLQRTDNRSLSDRIWAIFNGLFNQIYCKEASSIDSEASQCLIDILIILTNVLINNPQGHSILISNLLTDKQRLTLFLRGYLDHIDSTTNSQLSAHLNEAELEFTAILVGILRFIQKLSKHLEEFASTSVNVEILSIPTALATFPVPTFRRDSRGEVNRLGSRSKIVQPVNHEIWSNFIDQQVWLIIYSTLPWNNFLLE